MAFVAGSSNASPSKLGSDGDPIRQMLFASQSIKAIVAQTKLDGKPSPFQTISDASQLVDQGRREEAIVLLRVTLAEPHLETRLQLWVWTCLRELGEKPDERSGHEVLGVVLEMPSGGAYDTLACYVDGTARYLNYSGRAIFWDPPDPVIKALCMRFIDSSTSAGAEARPRLTVSLPKSGTQVTLLTRSGNYVITEPPRAVAGAGRALMIELIGRTKKMANQSTDPTSASPNLGP